MKAGAADGRPLEPIAGEDRPGGGNYFEARGCQSNMPSCVFLLAEEWSGAD